MGLIDRMAQALRPKIVAPDAVKTSGAGPVIAWTNAGQPVWTPRNFENLAREGFKKNVVAYRCAMQIAQASAAVPWLLYDQAGHEIDRHPLLGLLQHPNPLQDGVTFLESVYSYLQISGNAYIEAVMPEDDAAPVELYVLRPDRMRIVPGPAGLPQGYQYSVNGQTTSWSADPVTGQSAILHLKCFNPLDDWYGMAPMEAALVSIDQHNAAGSWNQALLNHGARPSGALVYAPKDGPATLTDEQITRLREELGSYHMSARNAGRPLILEGGLEWREMSLSPKDMDWLAGRNVAARDIALAFGIPAQLIGIPDAQTYANMAEARLAFYEETVIPLVTRVISGFDHWLTPLFDDTLELDFDADSISALSARREAQWGKLQNAQFLTRNEQRAAAGYGPVPGGDEDAAPAAPKAARQPAQDKDWLDDSGDAIGDEFGDLGDGSDDAPDAASDVAPGRQFAQEIPPVLPEEVEPLPGMTGGKPLPADPDDLLDQGYEETSHPDAAAAGHRTFQNPDNGDILRFDEGDPDETGNAAEDHYHRLNPGGSSNKDYYLDQEGNPIHKGAPSSHLFPAEGA